MPSTGTAPDEWLAEAFGRHAQRWAAETGASAVVAETLGKAAAALSRATSAGHVCMNLSDIAAALNADAAGAVTLDTLRQVLCESRLVGSAEDPGVIPFVLDAHDRFYLHRYFDYERRLARALAQRRASAFTAPAGENLPTNVAALLATLFPRGAPAHVVPVDWQKVAVITALLGRLTIISGGPGTGKTTVIVNLLACLLEENPACRVALAAPTGKAAVRITETIRLRAAHIPEKIKELLPKKSSTVHRLLGVSPKGGFLHDIENPLPIDVLVVDEASMLDLALATRLFEAVPPTARIILVGDKDQLAAVESGAVFAELSVDPRLSEPRVEQLARVCGVAPEVIQSPRPDPAMGLTDSVVWLKHNFRFGRESSIGRLAEEINAGDARAVLDRLRSASSPSSLTWIDDASPIPSPGVIDALCASYALYVDACRPHVDACGTPMLDPGAVSQAFGRFRVLCAVRDGHRGTTAINERMSAFFRRELDLPTGGLGRSEWYPGRPVVVLRNEYTLRLFNGDIGIALPDAAGNLMVYFPDAESGFRPVAPVRLPEHETAFAMTVHKAQGSEFDDVLVMLPAKTQRVLTRELLYTGVTRARARVTLVGSAEVVANAIQSTTERVSGLAARLRDATIV